MRWKQKDVRSENMSKATQVERVVEYMEEKGSITQLEAIAELGVMRLASRISDLKKSGVPIKSETVAVKNRYNEDCYIKRYSLVKEESECLARA
jgi:hypothetical protein